MKYAFVLGNGKSRHGLNLSKLKTLGKVYGCNALYRDFSPDYLIAVDTKMIHEIRDSEYQLKNQVWTNRRRSTDNIQGMNYFEKMLGWSSGPTALYLASTHKYDVIYIIGFDYKSIDEKVNNIYAGTKNYKSKDDKPTFFGNWENQTYSCIKNNPMIRYIRVIDNKFDFVPEKLKDLSNLEHIDRTSFEKIIEESGFF